MSSTPSEALTRLHQATVRHLGRLHATACSTLDVDMSDMPLRTLEHYAVSYLLEGAGRYVDGNGLAVPLSAGDFIVVCPGVAHRYGPGPKRRWREIWVIFEGPVFDLWRQAGILDPAAPIRHLEPLDHWRRRIESIRGLPQGPSSAPLLEISRLQQVLAEALVSAAVANFTLDDFAWSVQASNLLESDVGTALPELAKQLNMSYSAFRKRFTRIMGVSPAHYRSRHTIEEACRLIQQNDLTNQDLADRLGFADEFHFSHRFKQLMGRSPKVFREEASRSAAVAHR